LLQGSLPDHVFRKLPLDRLTVSESYDPPTRMAWTPHGYGNQQGQHFQLLDHRLLTWARGSKNERFGCLFSEIPY